MKENNSTIRYILYSFLIFLVVFSFIEVACQFIFPIESSRYSLQQRLFQVLDEETDTFFLEDPHLFWVFRPFIPLQTREHGLFRHLFTNSRGLRDNEVSQPKINEDYRILCIGDSCTFGVKLPYEQSFPKHIERLLAPPPDKIDVEVINAGIPGYSSFQGMQYLTLQGWRYHPDLVIACFGLNDRCFWNNRTDAEHYQLFQKIDLNTALEFLAIHRGMRKLIRWISYDVLARTSKNMSMEQLTGQTDARPPGKTRKHPFQDEEERAMFYQGARRRVPIEDYYAHIKEIINFSHSIQADILLINWPIKNQVTPPHNNLNEYQLAINRIGDTEKVSIVDLTRLLKQQSADIWLDRFHLDARGNKYVAEHIIGAIKNEIWLGRNR